MKKTYTWLVMLFASAFTLIMLGCNNNGNEPEPETEPPVTAAGLSTAIYYVDTFKVYSSDLSGGNRKLLINEDLRSENNYIAGYSIMPGNNKIVYHYTTGYLDPITIKIANADGTNIKVLKTLPVGTNLHFVKAIAGNRIYFATSASAAGTTFRRFFVMNEDGTNEKELIGLSSFGNINDSQVSSSGKGLVTTSGYFVKLNNDVFLETESYNVLNNEKTADIINNVIISSDATRIAFISRTSSVDKYEIRVKDITSRNTSSTVAYTYTIPATGPGAIQYPSFGLCWVDGNQKLLLSYGKMTFPKGAPSDYVFCKILTPGQTTVTSWNFTGDGSLTIHAN